MSFLNTEQQGSALPFKFGQTRYKTARDQRDKSERGPLLSLGTTCSIGRLTSYLLAWQNNTGCVTLLESSHLNLSSYNFDYITPR